MSREMEQGGGPDNDPIYATQTQHLALQRGTREALGRLEERMDAKLINLEERLENNFEALRMEIARMGRRHLMRGARSSRRICLSNESTPPEGYEGNPRSQPTTLSRKR